MTIRDAVHWGTQQLEPSSESPRLDAELFLADVLKQSTTFLFTHDLESLGWFSAWRYRRLIQKRKRGIPVAYLRGHKEFFGLDFAVNRHVLVPRPDTEILVEGVIGYLNQSRASVLDSRILLLDVGTGSGCIPVSVLKHVPGLRAVALDLSRAALRVARANAQKHGVGERIAFLHSDLLADLPPDLLKEKEIVLTANLPYLPEAMPGPRELAFEPRMALYAGPDGMDLYRRLAAQIETLRPKTLFLELFENQIPTLKKALPGYRVETVYPMSGQARGVRLERK